ncbi:MAG: prepilin-type N-terminal cleavage/methylation domain-containing protein [Campylobacterota bacterium]|nr:prepilin-type N-terminal cleavage/methylation domain-containing protein [Campylobacterota bacterium]
MIDSKSSIYKKQNFKKAFSLVELIFVISILGIIAALAIPKLLDSRSGAIVSTIKQDVSTISNSIQSHYMINNGISKITDAVNVNTQNWVVSDTQLEYKSKETTCITIVISGNKLNVDIFQDSSELCLKIYDSGVRSVSYDLF